MITSEPKKRVSKTDQKTLLIVLVILVIVAGIVAITSFASSEKSKAVQTADLAPQVTKTAVMEAVEEIGEGPNPPAYIQPYLERNFNTVGYIKIEDTRIDYPVVQSEDNAYYIDHNFDGDEDRAGAIFLDFRCDIDDFQKTRNIIIYGHRMKDGSQFKELIKYEDADFFREHPHYHI